MFHIDKEAVYPDEGSIILDNRRQLVVEFKVVIGAEHDSWTASFVDDPAIGGGATPRDAMRSLAAQMRIVADNLEREAGRPVSIITLGSEPVARQLCHDLVQKGVDFRCETLPNSQWRFTIV